MNRTVLHVSLETALMRESRLLGDSNEATPRNAQMTRICDQLRARVTLRTDWGKDMRERTHHLEGANPDNTS